MSEKLELLKALLMEAQSDPALRAAVESQGFKVKARSEPGIVQEALFAGRDAILEVLGNADEDQLTEVQRYSLALDFSIPVDFLNGEPAEVGQTSAKKVRGSAGTDKVFVAEDGTVWSDRVQYLHAQNIRVRDVVVSRQEDQKTLLKAKVNEDGVPTTWAEGENAGESIGDAMMSLIMAHIEGENDAS